MIQFQENDLTERWMEELLATTGVQLEFINKFNVIVSFQYHF